MMAAFAYVPVLDLNTAYNELCLFDYFVNNQITLQPLIDYFSSTRMGVDGPRRRRKPQFAHYTWNFYDRIINNKPRTTNAVEGWHNAFNRAVSRAHTSMGEFINCLMNKVVLMSILRKWKPYVGDHQRKDVVMLIMMLVLSNWLMITIVMISCLIYVA